MAGEQRAKDINKKMLVIIALSVAVGILIGLWLSMARYTSEIKGQGQYEPSLFNTVLLGDLTFFKGEDGNVMETGGKLKASIAVDASMEFGALEGGSSSLTSSERRLRPGSMIAIPFTVTNGTSLGDLSGMQSNLAGTDIVYTLNLITTVNIPLEYDVYEYTTPAQLEYMKEKSRDNEYNYAEYTTEIEGIDFSAEHEKWGTKLDVTKGNITSSELIGYSRSYEVRPTTYVEDEGESTELTNKFCLQRDEEGAAISIHRYMLVVYWPDLAEGDADGDEDGISEETKELRDTKYMKEIDILEVRLEVESWVENNRVSTPSYQAAGSPILRISSVPLGDERYYQMPEDKQIFSRTTIPFYATRELEVSGNKTVSYLDFTVTNKSDSKTYVYDEENKSYRATNLASLSGGRVAIAVPVQSTMGTANDYTDRDNFKYEIVYGGTTYTGSLSGEQITTDVDNKTIAAYQIVEFKDAKGNALTLADFADSISAQSELRLLVTAMEDAVQKNIHYDNKDDMKLFVYQKKPTAGDDGNE